MYSYGLKGEIDSLIRYYKSPIGGVQWIAGVHLSWSVDISVFTSRDKLLSFDSGGAVSKPNCQKRFSSALQLYRNIFDISLHHLCLASQTQTETRLYRESTTIEAGLCLEFAMITILAFSNHH